MCNRRRDELLARIASAKTQLSKLDEERTDLQLQISSLQDVLSSTEQQGPTSQQPSIQKEMRPRTTGEKIALFRSLFRGREDVFPKRWENSKKGTAGYSPACANEWVHGICDKPRVKCGDCPNQAFLPVTDQVILEHMQGRFVAGLRIPGVTDAYEPFRDAGKWLASSF